VEAVKMKKSWYLLCYRYGHAERAIKNLERLGVQCFSPRTQKTSSFGKGNQVRGCEKEHLFPPYLFVEFDPEDILISSIQCTPGVSGFVRFGQKINPVNDGVMDDLLKASHEANPEINPVMSKIIRCQDKQQRVIMFLSMMTQVVEGGGLTLNYLNG
jgi:transcription antitermination factor NusG